MLREALKSRSTSSHQQIPNFHLEKKRVPSMEMRQTYLTTRIGLQRVFLVRLQMNSPTLVDHHGHLLLLPPLKVFTLFKMAVKIGQISVCSN